MYSFPSWVSKLLIQTRHTGYRKEQYKSLAWSCFYCAPNKKRLNNSLSHLIPSRFWLCPVWWLSLALNYSTVSAVVKILNHVFLTDLFKQCCHRITINCIISYKSLRVHYNSIINLRYYSRLFFRSGQDYTGTPPTDAVCHLDGI